MVFGPDRGVIVPLGAGDNRRWKYESGRIISDTGTTGWALFVPEV